MAKLVNDPEAQLCGNCAFYKESGRSTGKCLRYPPVTVGQIGILAEFPGVRFTWWCGEYQDCATEGNEQLR